MDYQNNPERLSLFGKFGQSISEAWSDPEVRIFAGAMAVLALILYLAVALIQARLDNFKAAAEVERLQSEVEAQTMRADMAIVARERIRAEREGDPGARDLLGGAYIMFDTASAPGKSCARNCW
jgi:hypothetical protein